MAPELSTVKVDMPSDANLILGHSHFIKTVEDLYEAMVNSSPQLKFGIAFCEASQERLVRRDGNDEELTEAAAKTAQAIGAGHLFVIFMREGFPINVLTAIKNVYEVCRIFCATANPVEVVVAQTEQGRGVLGVVDGYSPVGVEGEKEVEVRKGFLRKIGYKR